MTVVARFTRDRVSRYVWGGVLIVALCLLAYAVIVGRREVLDERTAAQSRAVAYATGELSQPAAGMERGPLPAGAHDRLVAELRQRVLSDPRVSRVRVWGLDGQLLLTADRGKGTSLAALDASVLGRLPTTPVITVQSESASGPELETFVVLEPPQEGRTGVAAEIDQPLGLALGDVVRRWRDTQIAAGALVALVLLFTLLSLREPLERIGAGVRFYPGSVPEGLAVVERSQLREVDRVVSEADERASRMKERLQEAEAARRELEGELQIALSTAAAAGVRRSSRAPAVRAEPLGDTWAAPARPAVLPPPVAPVRALEPVPDIVEPVADEPVANTAEVEPAEAEREPVAILAEADAEPVAEVEIATAVPAVEEVIVLPEPIAIPAEALAEPVAEVEIATAVPAVEELIVLPEASAPDAPEDEESSAAAADLPEVLEPALEPALLEPALEPAMIEPGSARDLLARMLAASELAAARPDQDPGALRAALARTAARKKPGNRQEHPDGSLPPGPRSHR
ncbi:MAG: hypothetical protein HY240_06560 [Actinobacteria bacterium]|nr:hypothetical protein [Actinomycetota bacterium]